MNDEGIVEMFITAQSLSGLSDEGTRRARARSALARYRPLLARPLAIAHTQIGRWLLEFAMHAAPVSLSDEPLLDFITTAVWHAADHLLPLTLLADAFDGRLAPLLLAIGLDAQKTSPRALEVCAFLVAHAQPSSADRLALSLVPVLTRFTHDMLHGSCLARAQALELLAEIALHAPALTDSIASLFWHALLLDSMPVREQVAAMSFDVCFVLLARGSFADGSAQLDTQDFAPMLRYLPKMLSAPSVQLQRVAVAGVARLVWHACTDKAFEMEVSRVTDDECFGDKLLLQLVLRFVDARQAIAEPERGGGAHRLTDAEDREVLEDINSALAHMDEGVLADCVAFIIVRDVAMQAIDVTSPSGYGPGHAHTRRALHELVRRLTKRELLERLPESIGSSCSDQLGITVDPDLVLSWLRMRPLPSAV